MAIRHDCADSVGEQCDTTSLQQQAETHLSLDLSRSSRLNGDHANRTKSRALEGTGPVSALTQDRSGFQRTSTAVAI